jgi:hypothetical protein
MCFFFFFFLQLVSVSMTFNHIFALPTTHWNYEFNANEEENRTDGKFIILSATRNARAKSNYRKFIIAQTAPSSA